MAKEAIDPSKDPDYLEGLCFVQADTIGLASYHFVDALTVFIDYSNLRVENWRLDDGRVPPSRKQFEHTKYDAASRTFYGIIDWAKLSTTFDDAARWKYVMTFNSAFSEIESGSVTSLDYTGRILRVHYYGWQLHYRAALAQGG